MVSKNAQSNSSVSSIFLFDFSPSLIITFQMNRTSTIICTHATGGLGQYESLLRLKLTYFKLFNWS